MKNKMSKLDYCLIFFFIAISGNPYICYWYLASLMAFILIVFRFLSSEDGLKKLINAFENFKWYLIAFLCVFILQLFLCKGTIIKVQINYLIKIASAGLFYMYYKDNFKLYYLNIMTVLALISLILYPLVMSGFSFPNIFGSGLGKVNTSLHSLILYSYNTEFNFDRNAGMFWEPGCYACYLCLVPLLFINNMKAFVKENKIKCVILLLTLLTTRSTTGFLVISIILMAAFWKSNKYVGPILGCIIVFSLISSSVVTDKFAKDFATVDFSTLGQVSYYDGYNTENRLGTIYFLFPIFLLHPIIGNGINNEAMFSSMSYVLLEDHIGLGNGFMLYLVQLGLCGVLFYAIKCYKSWTISIKDRMIMLFSLLLLLQGEPLLLYPLFIGLPFYNFSDISIK